jgi:hypothetical protein
MADYTQLHHDNGYGFLQWILSVIICKDWQRGGGGFKIHFSIQRGTIFSKIDFKTEFEKIFKWSKKQIYFEAGFAIGDIPLTHLYNTSQITLQRNHYSKNHLFRENSFETMYFNEFSQLSSCISNLNMASIESLFSRK